MDSYEDDPDASGETDSEGADTSYEAVIAENIVQPSSPAQTSFTIIRPTISNLLASPVAPSINIGPDKVVDPTVRTLGVAASLIPAVSPTKRPRKPPISPPPPSNQPFKLTYAHLKAYRKLQLRKPTSALTSRKGKEKERVDDGTLRKKRRKMCIAEAAWKLWAERGGLGKAGKEIRSKEGEDGVRACMAYNYDEDGKPYKPTISHVQIIRLVLAASMEKMMTLVQIYQAIEARWPYFKTTGLNWKGSIRHNLSHHTCFQQITRTDEHGHPIKGLWWQVDEKLAGPLYPRSKDRPRKPDPSQPLLSTAPPSHPLHPSFAAIDPHTSTFAFTPHSNPAGTFNPIPYVPGTSSGPSGTSDSNPTRSKKRQRTKLPVVHTSGKAPDFPLPGIPPHPAGIVPPGYPNPLPAGWMGGWGDPTLVDLGKRYGGLSDELGDIGGEYDEPIDASSGGDPGVTLSAPTSSARDLSDPTLSMTNTSFAPLSEFSTCLSSLPSRALSTSSSTSSLSSFCSTSSLTRSSTPIPPHLPFLNLIHSSDMPILPMSDYPLIPFSTGSTSNTIPGPASTQLLKRGNGFVPPDVQAKWRKMSRTMSPFPGSGEWVVPFYSLGRSSDRTGESLGMHCARDEVGLPGIEEVLGMEVRRGDPRLSEAVQRRRGGRAL